MSSGVVFNEDYDDFYSDINRMGRSFALGRSINEFAASLKSGGPSGKKHHYVSMDTQVLGMVLQNATGKKPSEYLEEKIWKKLGMRSDANWLIDDTGMDMVFAALNVTARDYARLGLLYAHEGNWKGEQIVPTDWVKNSTTPLSPHVQPGVTTRKMGYGYQWWIPEHPQDDYFATGIYGQYIYVNPGQQVVIVKNSANSQWKAGDNRNRLISCMQQIASRL